MRLFFITVISIFFAIIPAKPATSEVLTVNTSWKGEVVLREDLLIPPGISLTIDPGTIIKVYPSDSTRIDPEYMSHQTEILVRGEVNGLAGKGKMIEVSSFSANEQDRWAGFIVDGGNLNLDSADISGAESALTILNGNASINKCTISKNRYGMVAQGPGTNIKLTKSSVTGNEYGLITLDGARIEEGKGTLIKDNSKKDHFSAVIPSFSLPKNKYDLTARPLSATYRNEALPAGQTVWKGRVLIDGQLRLPPESRLVILPGTIIEFTKHDTNNDSIGENGLQVQGHLVAKGTPEEPIIFRSAEKNKARGDWDSINILGSDQAQNIIEYCQIENAYRGLHFHFSNVAINQTVISENYRGIQFQESLVSIENSRFFSNKSAIQSRDSEVIFSNNNIFDNQNGANFFRLDLQATNNIFAGNGWDGVRIREGTSRFNQNLLIGNRIGILVADAVYGNFNQNIIAGNLESGFLARNADHIEINGNAIQGNGINGISLRDTRAVISDNLINSNGERGIGIISFTGIINNNNIINNGLYAIGIEGSNDIDATLNWWGNSDLDKEIYDVGDETGLGKVIYDPVRPSPIPFKWPTQKMISKTIWSGLIHANKMITVEKGGVLSVEPGTFVEFGKDAGLMVHGSLKAAGLPEKRISFTSRAKTGPGDWQGIRLERATGSFLEYCDLNYGEYGLHIHFVPMRIKGCRFSHNDIGIRFRSGPIRLSRSQFTKNRIGIRSFRGNMDIIENEITDNEIGVFIREGGKGVKLHRNNIYNNDRYNVRLGDFNKEDVEADNNWWGDKLPETTIFDGRLEPYIGKVKFKPSLDGPLKLELQSKGE